MNVYNNFIQNYQNWEVTQMSFKRSMNIKKTEVHPENGVFLSDKKK